MNLKHSFTAQFNVIDSKPTPQTGKPTSLGLQFLSENYFEFGFCSRIR